MDLRIVWTNNGGNVLGDDELPLLKDMLIEAIEVANRLKISEVPLYTCQDSVVLMIRVLVREKQINYDSVVFVDKAGKEHNINSNGEFDTQPAELSTLDGLLIRLLGAQPSPGDNPLNRSAFENLPF